VGGLTEVSVASVLAELRKIRDTPCPHCSAATHAPVDIDGPSGEYLRYCYSCGENFRVKP